MLTSEQFILMLYGPQHFLMSPLDFVLSLYGIIFSFFPGSRLLTLRF